MAQDITWLGNEYLAVPAIYLPKSSSGEAKFTDVSDTTAAAADVASGKYFYTADGTKTAGTASGGGAGAYAWLGSGAEKIETKDFSFNLSSGTSYDTWTPSTTATAIVASQENAYSYTGSLNDYDFCFVWKGFIEPVYVAGTPTTYRTHRVAQYHLAYYYGYPTNSSASQVQNDTAGNSSSFSTSSNFYVQWYYNNSGTLTARSATQCGPCYMSSYPVPNSSISNGSCTVRFTIPAFNAKCDTSRFTTARAAQVDSAATNYNLTLEVYRVPHGKGLASHLVSEMCAALNAT